MSFSEEPRNGSIPKAEYRPTLKLKGPGAQKMRMTLFEDVDLTKDYFRIESYQGGNRIGTARNPAFNKINSGKFQF